MTAVSRAFYYGLVLGLIGGVALCASTADAAIAPEPYTARAAAFKVPLPSIDVEVREETCGGAERPPELQGSAYQGACAEGWRGIIWLPAAYSDFFRHEVGHVFDYANLDDADRAKLLRLTHRTGLVWSTSGGEAAELFAVTTSRGPAAGLAR
jgi:hypothetical protein